uniref:DUF834 domain-containing protein n=1 Tax=Oryza meridionalis TaxID=40149 RepID=A0A0E0E117_9ORYZ
MMTTFKYIRRGQGDLEVNRRWAGKRSARTGGVRRRGDGQWAAARGRAVGGGGRWTAAQGQAVGADGRWAVGGQSGGNSVDRDNSEGGGVIRTFSWLKQWPVCLGST